MSLPLLSLMLIVFGLTTGEFVIAGILPEVASDLSTGIPAVGLLITAYALGMIIGGPVVTVATAHVPRRPLVLGLVGVSVAANLASAAAPTYPLLLASRFLAGLVVATFFAVAVATAVASAAPDRAGSAVAKVTVGMNLGILAGTPLGTLIGQHAGWRAAFAAVAVFTLAALLLALRTLPGGPPIATGPVLGELRVLADRGVQLAVLLTVAANLGVVTVFGFLAPLLTGLAGFSAEAVPALLLVYGAGAVAGNFLGGRLADKRLLPSLIGLLTALALVLLLLGAAGDARPAVAVLVFALGVLAFAIIPGTQALVISAAGAAPTLAVAVNASAFQLSAAGAGRLGGWIIGDGSGLAALYPVAAALTAAGVAVAIGLTVRARRADARMRACTPTSNASR